MERSNVEEVEVMEDKTLFSGQFENSSASMRRHAETQRLQLIQQGANCRYEAGALGIKQQS